ncbi:MAG: hybrid sensor histidine kinase/response regulator [Candidatus Hodarchaeales archaeon]|jgi:PAS domain S-box-containing protein
MSNAIKILLIDDNQDFSNVTGQLLNKKNENFIIESVDSSVKAIEKIKLGDFDLIVCDYDMPVYTGIEILDKIRQDRIYIPFIMLTGKGREEVVIEALNKGADYYLQKGIDTSSMISELYNFILKENEKIIERRKRRIIEDELKTSSQRYQQLLEFLPIGVVVHSDGKVIYINEAMKVNFGAEDKNDINGVPITKFIHPDYIDISKKRIAKMLLSKKSAPLIKQKYIRLDGTSLNAEVVSTPIEFQGKTAIQSVLRVIDTEIEYESELKQARDQLDTILRSIKDSIVVLDENFRILFLNDVAARVFGFESSEIASQFTTEDITKRIDICDEDHIVLNQPGVIRELTKSINKNEPSTIIIKNKMTGEETWHQLKVSEAIDNRETQIRVVVGHEFTETKMTENELLKQKEETSLFLDIISHDMINFLSIIKGSLDLIDLKDDKVSVNKLLGNAKRSSVRSMELLKNVSVLMKQQLLSPDDLVPINLLLTLENVENSLKEAYKERKITIDIQGITKSMMIKADSLIEQAFFNVLTNSVKYDDKENIEIEIKLESNNKKNKEYVISFNDYGRGIVPGERHKLFARFAVFKDQGKGSGLGLSIVKTLIERYQGKVWVESRVPEDYKQGTKILFQLKTD